jgi:hypothetical protein
MPCPPPLKRLTADGDELLKSTEAEKGYDVFILHMATVTVGTENHLPGQPAFHA